MTLRATFDVGFISRATAIGKHRRPMGLAFDRRGAGRAERLACWA
jgi:hypothetical protein